MNAFEGAVTPDDDPFSEVDCTKGTCEFDMQCIGYEACCDEQTLRDWRADL